MGLDSLEEPMNRRIIPSIHLVACLVVGCSFNSTSVTDVSHQTQPKDPPRLAVKAPEILPTIPDNHVSQTEWYFGPCNQAPEDWFSSSIGRCLVNSQEYDPSEDVCVEEIICESPKLPSGRDKALDGRDEMASISLDL
jgi:hypothetical protein